MDGTGVSIAGYDMPSSKEVYKYAAFVCYFLSFLALVLPCLLKKQIKLCIALVRGWDGASTLVDHLAAEPDNNPNILI